MNLVYTYIFYFGIRRWNLVALDTFIWLLVCRSLRVHVLLEGYRVQMVYSSLQKELLKDNTIKSNFDKKGSENGRFITVTQKPFNFKIL